MLQISNLDDSKSEWNVNETHIIIPMIDGDIISKDSNKITRNTITLNALEGGDQTVLTNGLEHSLVIGLDRNLFETNKSDLLVIQNSDLKLLSCNSDSKVTYTLSYVDQDRSEILWESPILKDRTKGEWCTSDKTIFEVKDVLNYDESVQESSKNWHDELVKNKQINLDDVGGDISTQVAKIDGGILIPVEDAISEGKKLPNDSDGDSHFIVNYYQMQGCETISMSPNSTVINVTKQVENSSKKSVMSKNDNLIEHPLLVNASIEETCNLIKWGKTQGELLNEGDSEAFKDAQETILDIVPEQVAEEYDGSVQTASNSNDYVQYGVKRDFAEELQGQSKNGKDDEKEVVNGVRSCLPEKSLPLKKKAKMKRTLMSSVTENSRSLLKQDVKHQKEIAEVTVTVAEKKSKLQPGPNLQPSQSSNSDSDEPLINRVRKQKKTAKVENQPKSVQEKVISNYLVNQSNLDEEPDNPVDEDKSEEEEKESKLSDGNSFGLNERKFNSIYELVEELKKYRLINASVWQTLHSGLKEMNVDILKEMNTKRKQKSPPGTFTYSTHLKAFALVVYFKQPAAFNHLAKIYKNGWPSLDVIKDWKQRLNTHQRPNFVGLRRNEEDTKS